MNKDGLVLVFTTILLCAAAGAAATGAFAEPSGSGGTVQAPFSGASEGALQDCFVSAEEYSEQISGKSERQFDPSLVRLQGVSVPYDRQSNTIYIPQDMGTGSFTGTLSALDPYRGICIWGDENPDKAGCIEEGRPLKMAVVSPKEYMECSLVFTGLPAVCLGNEENTVESDQEYKGNICVLDPFREENQETACTFHIRGATSVLFDKKSYRIELQKTAAASDKMSFLGLRKDDDWILNSLSTDKSLVREKICYDLWEKINAMEEEPVPSSQIRLCELFLNNEYVGVYGLMYPVDRKLMNMKPGDLLYKVKGWYEETDFPGKLTDYNGQKEIVNQKGTVYMEVKYPGEPGEGCIYDPFERYQDMVFETGSMSEMEKAGVHLNLDNFILHELFCEMTRAGDNTWKNMYIAAYSDNRGGYTLSETIWDLNYTFGDAFKWIPEEGNTVFLADSVDRYKLRYDRDYGYTALSALVEGLREDTADKWALWRSEGIGADYVNALFREEREYLMRSGALERNAQKWSVESTEQVYDEIEKWVEGRFEFMDQMYGYSS